MMSIMVDVSAVLRIGGRCDSVQRNVNYMTSRKTCRHLVPRGASGLWLTVTLLASSLVSPPAVAQTFFYNEVVKDGRIYVFAVPSRYDAFVKGGGAETGPVIERQAYGPNGETVVFDSRTAINLYNFKHGLPGEAFPELDESAASFPSHKFSGLMFGDYYWYYDRHQDGISSTDPTAVEGQHGLWFRRLYFTYDFAYSEKLSTRFRLEANSNGEFDGGDIVPYVKDAYLKWSYKGQQQLTFGIHPTLTFDWLDGFWGLRHIEKTPADLYRLDSSRDFGFTFGGSAPLRGFTYAVQFGNESGNGSETREGKILRFETRYHRDSGLALEGFYSFGTGPSGENRHTAQGIAGFQREALRVGAQYLWQARQSGDPLVPDQTIGIWSGFVVWDVVPKRMDLFLRSDFVEGDLGGVETGLPDAEDIDYLLLSSQAPFSTWIVGGEWYLHPAVRLGPNLEIVRYTRDPDPVQFPGRRQDATLRFTFYWTF
jgi:hypothetical protein